MAVTNQHVREASSIELIERAASLFSKKTGWPNDKTDEMARTELDTQIRSNVIWLKKEIGEE